MACWAFAWVALSLLKRCTKKVSSGLVKILLPFILSSGAKLLKKTAHKTTLLVKRITHGAYFKQVIVFQQQ